MRKEIRDLIKRAYPTNRYRVRNKALLDRYLRNGTIEALGRRLAEIREVDCQFRAPEGGYDIYYMFRLCHPQGATQKLDAVESKKERVQVYRTLPTMFSFMEIRISQLGPYYLYFWNYYKVIKGQARAYYSDEPPTIFWKEVEGRVRTILREFGLQRLTPSELGQLADWIDPEDTIIAKGLVTVSNCLFSEIL